MRTVSLFRNVAGPARAALERCQATRSFAPGEPLFAQGDPPTEMFLIDEGRVKVWRATEDGVAITLTLLGPGALLGTLGSVQNRPHNATATALTMVTATAWPIDVVRRIMTEDGVLAASILRTVTAYAEQMIQRLEEVAVVPIEQRLARTLLRQASQPGAPVDLILSRQDLADLTSATLPTVSRIMSGWRKQRWIGGGRGKVRILDPARLAEIGEGQG